MARERRARFAKDSPVIASHTSEADVQKVQGTYSLRIRETSEADVQKVQKAYGLMDNNCNHGCELVLQKPGARPWPL